MAEETENQETENTETETTSDLSGKTGEDLKKSILKKKTERADMTELPEEKKLKLSRDREVQDEEILDSDSSDYALGATSGDVDEFSDDRKINKEDYKQTAPEPDDDFDPNYVATTVGDLTNRGEGKKNITLDAATDTMSDNAKVDVQKGTLSTSSIAVGETEDLDTNALVSTQIGKLFEGIKSGTELPAWASPAVRKASAIMAQRGLGSSSMAAAAITQAIYESAIPIATADANAYSKIQLQNLSNKQAATLQSAINSAAMDTANLNAAQTAAVNTAKNFLAIDLKNLDNEQQAAVIDYQTTVKGLFTDAAAQNAAAQFNAKTDAEVEQFFSELDAQVETTSKNRQASLEQYNISQEVAIEQFNAQMESTRDQFNANMRRQIDAATAVWRRTINTENTAAENEEIRQNLQLLLELSETAQNDLWQQYRDMAAWTMQTSENNIDRAHNAAMQSQAIDANSDIYDDKFDDFLIVETIDNIFD